MPTKRARITDRDPLTPTDKVLAQYEQVNKSSSQLPESAGNETQSPKQESSTQVDKLASQQSNKSASQQAKISKSNQPTSQQSKNIASQIVDVSTSQQVDNPKSTSQQPNKLTSEQANMTELDQVTSQFADNQVRQQVDNLVLRKATFQVDAAILDALDRYHLQLQIELGKRNAPYKEILVEEAIAIWLERATKSPDRVVKSLLKRQEHRSV
jgi:hypothetical protein